MKPEYSNTIRMVYTDTDSFVFHTKTDDLYIYIHIYIYRFERYNRWNGFEWIWKNQKCYDACNKKVLGKFNDEVHVNI